LPFLLLGLALLSLLAPGVLSLGQAGLLVLPLVLAVVFVIAVRFGLGREQTMRLASRIPALARLSESLSVVNASGGALLRAAGWHLTAWTLGALEVWVILWVLGTPVGLEEAYVIEALGMAARSLGFVLPAGLGAQEAGLAAVSVALGVPLEAAVAMAMLKRLREVAMNLPGLLYWQWTLRRPRNP
jgi:uncharacterized membrane protein YbhN (UPF0104 family)